MRRLCIFCTVLLLWFTLCTGVSGAVALAGDAVVGTEAADATDETQAEDAPEDLETGDASLEETDSEAVSPTPSPAPTAAPVVNADFTIEVELGYEGLVAMTRWTPAFVTVTNNGPDFDGLLGVNVFYAQTEYDRYELPVTLASGATKKLSMPIRPRTRQDMYAFELVEKGTIIAEERVSPKKIAAPETVIVGVLSDDPAALSYINQRANGLDTLRGEVWSTVSLSADTFPDTGNLMSSFTMLVVDGMDPRTLSDTQQAVLRSWLMGGGIVFVSGGAQAAAGYPFFSEWTQLSPGKLTESEDITPELLSYAAIKGVPAGETVWLSDMPASGALFSKDSQGLLSLHTAGSGFVYLTAFDFGGKPLSTWASMSAFWPRALRQSIPNEYMTLLDRIDENRWGGDTNYRATELINTLRIPNGESGAPILLVLALYLVLVGFGGYLLFKKLDRREWLWGAIPASALVFSLVLMLLSRGGQMNKPVALTGSRVLLDGESAQVTTYLAVAAPDTGEMVVEADQPQLPAVISQDGSYYYDESGIDRLYRPVNLRQRYTFGAHPSVGFASKAAWDEKMLLLDGMQADIGTLAVKLWMEADGLHGEVVNNTDQLMREGMLITSFGYCVTGDLLPGQSAKLSMILPDKPIDFSSPSFRLKPNVLYASLDVDPASFTSMGGGYYDMRSFLNAAVYGDDDAAYTDPVKRHKNALVSLFEPLFGYYPQSGSSYYFFAFGDSIGQVDVKLNGKPVTRTAHSAVIASKAVFEPIGPTGEVLFHQGLIPAEVIVDMGEDEKPRLPTEADGEGNQNRYGAKETYLNLGAPAALRFVLPKWGEYTVEKMTLAGSTYESMPTMYLFNHETGKWDEQLLLTVSMAGDKWAPYIDKDGQLFVRYVPGEGANRYAGMQMPSIALKGKVKE